MNCSIHSELESFAAALVDGLKAELFLTPKPGLVDLYDSGSHSDLSLDMMLLSIHMLENYLQELCTALSLGENLQHLIAIGKQAEQSMFERLGSNSHRGGIFICGLLLTARARCPATDPALLRREISRAAEDFFNLSHGDRSNGQRVRHRFGVGGIVLEALQGLPSLFDIVIPALSDRTLDAQQRIWLAMSRLMQNVEDTTTLHRCGQTGLARLKKAGKQLEETLVSGIDPGPLLFQLNRDFKTMNLTMGGVADLLGAGFGCHSYLTMRLESVLTSKTAHNIAQES